MNDNEKLLIQLCLAYGVPHDAQMGRGLCPELVEYAAKSRIPEQWSIEQVAAYAAALHGWVYFGYHEDDNTSHPAISHQVMMKEGLYEQ